MSKLATTESRRPMLAALGECPTKELSLWKDELGGLAVELAKRFHGSQTEGYLRLAFEDAVNLCEMGLLITDGGAPGEAGRWSRTLRELGVRGLTAKVTELAKVASSPPDSPFWSEHGDESPLSVIKVTLQAARASNAKAALAGLERRGDKRNAEVESHKVGDMFLETATGRAVYEKMSKVLRLESNRGKPNYEIFVFQTMVRLIGVPEDQIPPPEAGIEEDFPEEASETEDGPFLKIVLGPVLYARAKKAFDKVMETIPERSRPFLTNHEGPDSWYDLHVEIAPKELDKKGKKGA